MRADVLTSAASWHNEQPLLTYTVPDELADLLRAGQLVAIPYGNRLVQGVVWRIKPNSSHETINLTHQSDEFPYDGGDTDQQLVAEVGSYALRPIAAILDVEPVLLPHQRELAEWMTEYYVTPLAQTAMLMFPPGLTQRSEIVLHLAKHQQEYGNGQQPASLRLQALIGLLLSDGELNIEQLKKMLGAQKAKEVLKEAVESGLIEREAQLSTASAKKRIRRVVRLAVRGEELAVWRHKTEALLRPAHSFNGTDATGAVGGAHGTMGVPMAPDNVRRRPKRTTPDPWALPITASSSVAMLTLAPQDHAALLAQRQLAAVDLLQYADSNVHWTPTKLCKASKLTVNQLQKLVDEHIAVFEEVEVQRDPLRGRTFPPSQPLPLTPDQEKALQYILGSRSLQKAGASSIDANRPVLLHGVTGSGKTEVYLQALEAIIAQGKRGIVLVPEIVLTTQAIERFASRFPGRVAIIHGDLYMGERYDEWRRIRAGAVDVVIGSRSALFAPVPELGLIILDEEHEPAYKQSERRPTYHARETAITLGHILQIPVVLGSATPSIETFYRAEQDEYALVELPGRIGAALPPVEVIDLRNELHAGNTSIISRRLQHELEQVLSMKQQAILFLNRRGAASCVLCRDCGYVAMCERCDIPLTYHSTESVLLCHYCNSQHKVLHSCPQCGSVGIRYFGLGTEKVMDTIQRSFPTARLLRWDRDTARDHRAHQGLLDRFSNREADILVGTQMIAKGLDLPGVTLVGVISADIALNLPDFAAAERAFTLLTQVAGRAGRGEEAGRVIIQTFNPQHFCIDTASRHNFHEFYAAEIEARRRYGYPPFRQFVKFTYSHENRRRSQNEAFLLREQVDGWIGRLELVNTDVVGPAPALMERVRNKYHWQMIVRGPDLHPLLRVLDTPGWSVDIDPVSAL